MWELGEKLDSLMTGKENYGISYCPKYHGTSTSFYDAIKLNIQEVGLKNTAEKATYFFLCLVWNESSQERQCNLKIF